ncbi:GntR family transcriptional regulator [Alkalihalobacillus pseudalcaliphilus]|uniref:GntR family transcriptional regulator n=1 Tax=Alkalihalobacillus pseudalcaliphilus TaxID=79884 RepID=UPI00064E03EC|nr:GntR family transcriptional regulator [Alkalihalobacillus pseudalcaliphilus]KMK74717.1 hypothetical protein AB990_19730 [Alkalihalobacillus pseudalcaliphilus]
MKEVINHDLFAIKTEQVKSLRDIVAESLREAIVTGKLQPGEHLKERELSSLMGVSTTPIKEAFRMLGREGLVETIPRKGTYVSNVAESTIQEVQMLRAVLEGLCAKLAAQKITEQQKVKMKEQITKMEQLLEAKEIDRLIEANTRFHQIIKEAAASTMINQVLENTASLDKAFRKRALMNDSELKYGFVEHKKVYEAIIHHHDELAEHLMKDHILRTLHDVLKTKE